MANAPDQWRRHPADLARAVGAALVLGAALLLAWTRPGLVRSVSADIASLFSRLPAEVQDVVVGVLQLVALAVVVAIPAWLAVNRRWRLLGVAVVAAAVAASLTALLQGWLDRTIPPLVLRTAEGDAFIGGRAFPSGAFLAGLTATLAVLDSQMSRSWRKAAWLGLGVAVVSRIATTVQVPLNLAVTLAIGVLVGSLVMLALGAPVRRLQLDELRLELGRLGVAVDGVHQVDVRASHARTFLARGAGDRSLFVKLLDRDARDADLMLRAYRALRVKGLDDERRGWSPERLVQQEALATSLAGSAGAASPEVVAVGRSTGGDGIVVMGEVPGTPMLDLPVAAWTDDLLLELWGELDRLHDRRIAHRWASAAHVVVAADGRPVLVDYRWARLAADDQLLAADVAEMATSLALRVGAPRAVATAAQVIPAERLAAALPLVQPAALTSDVRGPAKREKGVLDEVRTELQQAAGVESYKLADLDRITIGSLVALVGTVVLVYVGLAFASNWSAISEALQEADWSRMPAVVIASALTYFTGAASLIGAVAGPLPFGRTSLVMLAQTFLNRFTPANAGGMALRARYLQRQGIDLLVASASVGITSAASGVAQAVLIVVFAVWAGSQGSLSFDLPSVSTVALVLLGILALGALVYLSPWGRRLVRERLAPAFSRVWGELSGVARQPTKLGLLFGGALAGKLATIAAFVLSCRALGITNATSQLCLLYMTANTVASAAPTPGGVGAVEAALVAVLTGAGVEPATALSATLVFRLATYWLPVPFSYVALTYVRRAEIA